MPLSPAFEKAIVEAKKLKEPGQDEQLKLYALFKIGHNMDFESAPKPGITERFSAAKYKYNAWKELREKGVTPPQAQKEYVQLFETLRAKYGMQ